MAKIKKTASFGPENNEGADWGKTSEDEKARLEAERHKLPKTGNPRVKTVHLAIGVDLLGSKTSLSAKRGTSLEMTAIGIKAHSDGSGRTVVIPYSNVKGFELFPGE